MRGLHGGWQSVTWTISWNYQTDDGSDADTATNPGRKTHILKLYDPENPPDDPLDPETFIAVPVIDSMTVSGWAGANLLLNAQPTAEGNNNPQVDFGSGIVLTFVNNWDGTQDAVDKTSRKVKNVRVDNHDTSADDQLTSDDGTPRKVDSSQYQILDDGDQHVANKDNYIETELINSFVQTARGLSGSQAISFTTDLQHALDSQQGVLFNINFTNQTVEDAQGMNSTNDPIYPFRLDPFQTIVNVNWGGLAVQFLNADDGNGMGELESDDTVPEHTEAIMSFWYHVEQKDIDAWVPPSDPQTTIGSSRIFPLITWGKEGAGPKPVELVTRREKVLHSEGKVWPGGSGYPPPLGMRLPDTVECLATFVFETHPLCILQRTTHTWVPYDSTGYISSDHYENFTVLVAGTGTPDKKPPCYIGFDQLGFLTINLESDKTPDVTQNFSWNEDVASPGNIIGSDQFYMVGTTTFTEYLTIFTPFGEWFGGDLHPVQVDSQSFTDIAYAHTDISALVTTQTGTLNFGNGPPDGRPLKGQWHHVLLSYKLGTCATHGQVSENGFPDFPNGGVDISAQVDSALKVYLAVDDHNYTKYDLSNVWTGNDGKPNDVITGDATAYALSEVDPTRFRGPPPFTPPPAKFSLNFKIPEGKIGIPAITNYLKDILSVEMAEFQMWIGQSFDTGDVSNRRLFIDDNGKPVRPSIAEKALGKPFRRLHGSGKWIKGHDTGDDGADWTPKGTIKKWRPDPSLDGKQEPP
jgi:hypothetical protein